MNLIFVNFLYGYEMWSLILSEELKLQAFRSNVLKKICGPKKKVDGKKIYT